MDCKIGHLSLKSVSVKFRLLFCFLKRNYDISEKKRAAFRVSVIDSIFPERKRNYVGDSIDISEFRIYFSDFLVGNKTYAYLSGFGKTFGCKCRFTAATHKHSYSCWNFNFFLSV